MNTNRMMVHRLWLSLLLLGFHVSAEVQPANVFSDNMVLQRGIPVSVWGTSDPGEEVRVCFAGQTRSSVADPQGNWRVVLDAMVASTDGRVLEVTGDRLRGFTICGEDRVFVRADAEITAPNQVTVSSPEVPNPVAVRYAWSSFPLCNLYNKDGLPVGAFRTDDFEHASLAAWRKRAADRPLEE